MPVAHFTRDDFLNATVGTVLLALFLVPPGFVFGWILNLLDFRKRSFSWRILLSIALSVSMVPIVVFLLWTYVSIVSVAAFYAACALGMVCLAFMGRRPSKPPAWILWPVLGWAAIAIFSGVDWQMGNRLYPSVLSYDFNLRSALIGSIARTGLPATNPLFYAGHAAALRYHYFWFLPLALIERWSGFRIEARQLMIAGDVWCGWALMALAVIFLRYFHPSAERGIESRAKWTLALLAVAGLDVIPNLLFDIYHLATGGGPIYASSEWWNTQVTGLPDAVLWVAHHVAAVVACFTGFLILWRRARMRDGLCAGLCFASSAGLSIYVTFTFAIFLGLYGLGQLFRKEWRVKAAWLVAGLFTVICAAPYLKSLQSASGPGGAFVVPAVRSFTMFDWILPAYGLNWNQIALANFAILPLNYFLETGVWFLLAGLVLSRLWRRRRATEMEIAALCVFVTSILVATFLKSAVIPINDLGYRAPLIAQFILLIWSVDLVRAFLHSPGKTAALRRWRTRTIVLASLGLASTVYELAVLRVYLPLADAGVVPTANWFSADRQAGRRTYDAREVYERLNRNLPADAIVQENSNRWSEVYVGLYANRQTAAFDFGCGTGMGGNVADCNRLQSQLVPLFNDPSAAKKVDVDAFCDQSKIDVLVIRDDDPIFWDRSSWARHTALGATPSVRGIRCGKRGRGSNELCTSCENTAMSPRR